MIIRLIDANQNSGLICQIAVATAFIGSMVFPEKAEAQTQVTSSVELPSPPNKSSAEVQNILSEPFLDAFSSPFAPSVETPAQPVVTDQNGVSGIDGSITFSHTISLGSKDHGIQYSLIYNSGEAATYRGIGFAGQWAWRDTTSGSVGCFADPSNEANVLGGSWATIDGRTEITQSGLSERIASDEPLPSQRSPSPGGGIVNYQDTTRYTHTRSDGTVVHFIHDGVYENDQYGEQGCGRSDRVDEILRPNGEIIKYHYGHDGHSYDLNVEKRIVISSNLGYQIRISGSPYGPLEGRFGCLRMGYHQHEQTRSSTACISSIIIVDTSIDNCPVDSSCIYSMNWPRLSINHPSSGVTRISDSLGNSTIYTETPQSSSPSYVSIPLITRVQSPGGLDRHITYNNNTSNNWRRGNVTSISEGNSVWNYSYQYNGPNYFSSFVGNITATDPTGRATVYKTSLRIAGSSGIPGPYISSIVGPGGATTTYNWFGYHNYRVKNITYPSGLKVEYDYDTRHNLTHITHQPAGGGIPIQVIMGYDANCSNIYTCNKPNYRIDELGRRTDFTYDPGHGSLLTVVGPAAGIGPYSTVRPQTSYEYESGPAGIVRLVRTRTCSTAQTCIGSADESVAETLYDARHRPVRVTNRAGSWTATTESTSDPRSSVSSITYSAFGDVATIDGPLPGPADTTRMYYDAMRRLIATVSPDPDGAGPLPRRVERFVYDADGRQIRAETGTATAADGSNFLLSRFRRSTYDGSGLLIKVEEVVP